jgi:nicotinate-nucleotide adenylyltransferase
MSIQEIGQTIQAASQSLQPSIHFIKKTNTNPKRLGIFASSFNPITTAHLELMQQARMQFALDEIVALAGIANADKSRYAVSIEERLTMLRLALEGDPHISIALSSHAFFVDQLDALAPHLQRETELHFILGFDTFERVLDCEDKYTRAYYRKFQDRTEALQYLLRRSHLIVASRAGAKQQALTSLINKSLTVGQQERVLYLDFPEDLGEQSASTVRKLIDQELSIAGLVPEAVERYIKERGLYC